MLPLNLSGCSDGAASDLEDEAQALVSGSPVGLSE
jgi:hypothetical protein